MGAAQQGIGMGYSIEDGLNMRGYGYWAASGNSPMLDYKIQPWAREYMAGYRVSSSAPDIDHEYALQLDLLIAKLFKEQIYMKELIRELYIYNKSLRAVAKSMRTSTHAIQQLRDAALNQVYGALKNMQKSA